MLLVTGIGCLIAGAGLLIIAMHYWQKPEVLTGLEAYLHPRRIGWIMKKRKNYKGDK